MTPNQVHLESIIGQLHQVPENLRLLYSLKAGIAHIRAKIGKEALRSAACCMTTVPSVTDPNRATVGIPLDCANQIELMWHRGACAKQELEALGRVDSLERLLTEDPLMAEASAVLDPLCAERDRLIAQIESDRITLAEAGAAADRAHQAAISKAIQAANQDPDVLRTRKALQAFEPEAPTPDIVLTRGRMKLGKTPDENVLAMLAD